MRGEGEEEPIRAAQTDAGKCPISETEAPVDEPQGRRRRARHVAELAVDEPTATEPSVKPHDGAQLKTPHPPLPFIFLYFF